MQGGAWVILPFSLKNLKPPKPLFHRSIMTVFSAASSAAFSSCVWAHLSSVQSSCSRYGPVRSRHGVLILLVGRREVVSRIMPKTVAPYRTSSLVQSACLLLLAERLAVKPSFVAGTYAPPLNLKPHLLHIHIPTLSRLTDLELHCGQTCFFLISERISLYLLLAVTPYLAPSPPAGPIFFFLFRRLISSSPLVSSTLQPYPLQCLRLQ